MRRKRYRLEENSYKKTYLIEDCYQDYSRTLKSNNTKTIILGGNEETSSTLPQNRYKNKNTHLKRCSKIGIIRQYRLKQQ